MKILRSPLKRKCIAYFFIFLTLFSTNGCHYFKIRKSPANAEETNALLNNGTNRYIVHSANNVMELKALSFDKEFIHGTLTEPVLPVRYTPDRSKRFKGHEMDIVNEVHFYVKYDSLSAGIFKIPLTDINEIKIIDADYGREIASVIGVSLVAAVGVFIIIFIIVLLTKSSCPYVYVHDGDSYVFTGETFGGAIGKNLERDDYMPLPKAKSDNGIYRVKISNELKEKQFTDIAALVVVDHPKGTKVLLDKTGKPYTFAQPVSPASAKSFNGTCLLQTLESHDNQYFSFDNQEYSKNGVILEFDNRDGKKDANLVINAKNSLWFDYLYGEFISKFGSAYDSWHEKESQIPTEERMKKVLESDIPLSVYMKVKGQWKPVENIMTVGPLAARDFIIPLDLRNVTGDKVEIKLETGFMFWEVDYASIDFTDKTNLTVNTYFPESAYDNNENDWSRELSSIDNKYMAQLKTGEATELIFNVSKSAKSDDTDQSVFLYTRGYYSLIREFKGAPKLTELYKFKQPGYFSDFSKEQYLEWLRGTNLIVKNN